MLKKKKLLIGLLYFSGVECTCGKAIKTNRKSGIFRKTARIFLHSYSPSSGTHTTNSATKDFSSSALTLEMKAIKKLTNGQVVDNGFAFFEACIGWSIEPDGNERYPSQHKKDRLRKWRITAESHYWLFDWLDAFANSLLHVRKEHAFGLGTFWISTR